MRGGKLLISGWISFINLGLKFYQKKMSLEFKKVAEALNKATQNE